MEEKKKIIEISERLESKYGKLEWKTSSHTLAMLLKTILSQNTNDRNRDLAYQRLKEEFPTYKKLTETPEDRIAKAIQVGGLHNQKASRIKNILRRIKKERGEYRLDYLENMSTDEALEELLKFDGVGKKTAGIVLLFSLKKPYFPVDTHIKRLSIRLGLVGENEDPHEKLNQLIPSEIKYQLHLHLIQYGREICKARNPGCRRSIFRDICKFYKEKVKEIGKPF